MNLESRHDFLIKNKVTWSELPKRIWTNGKKNKEYVTRCLSHNRKKICHKSGWNYTLYAITKYNIDFFFVLKEKFVFISEPLVST